MTVSFDLTLADLTSVQSALDVRRARDLSWVAVAAAGICLPAMLAAGMSAVSGVAIAFLVSLLVGAVLFWVRPALRRQRLRRDYRRYAHLRGPVSYTFTPAGVCFRTEGSELRLPWSAFTQIRDDSDYLFFDVSDAASYFIPKRVLGQADLGALCDLAATNFPATAVRTSGE